MTVNEILGWSPDQFMRLTKPELKEATQILASAGNKRIKRAQAEGFGSASIDAVLKKGKFSTADKSFAQLRNEFTRARSFLQSKTGTLSEIAKFKKESIAALEEASGLKISPSQFDTFWRAYEELRKNDPSIAEKGFKYAVLEQIDSIMKEHEEDMTVEDIVNELQGKLNDIYETNQMMTSEAEESATDLGAWLDELPEVPEERRSGADEEDTRSAARAAQRKSRRKRT